jgi:hypothetical protein
MVLQASGDIVGSATVCDHQARFSRSAKKFKRRACWTAPESVGYRCDFHGKPPGAQSYCDGRRGRFLHEVEDPSVRRKVNQRRTEDPTAMSAPETDKDDGNLVYLPKDFWSPRYDSNFYTLALEGKQYVESDLPVAPAAVGGKKSLPAYYYEIVVYREHDRKRVLRRYSQFKWLHEQILAHPPPPGETAAAEETVEGPFPRFPPGSCPFQWQDEVFAQNRMEQLAEYIANMLSRPGYARHPAVVAFLEL